MNYLGRPVFTRDIDWKNSVNRAVNYDLREQSFGFGSDYFAATESNTVQGWSFSLSLNAAADVADVDSFFDALYGRLTGFWLPVPFEAMVIRAAVSATQFDVEAANLQATWENRPDKYLLLDKGDGTLVAAAITDISPSGDYERVTVDVAWNAAPGMSVRKLHYVRLADDSESATFDEEWRQVRTVNVVELPSEYAAVETGQQPIWLYHFWADAPVLTHWYYTSFAGPVWSGENQYLAHPMNHGEVRDTSRGETDSVDIDAQPDPTHPLSLFFPAPFGGRLNVEIQQATLADLGAAATRFRGIVRSVTDTGQRYTAHCSSNLYLLDTKLPRTLIQPICNYHLFDKGTCDLRRQDWETSVIIVEILNDNPTPTVRVQMAFPLLNPERERTLNWFAGGIFETGFHLDYEPRSILGSIFEPGSETVSLTLNLPLWKAVVGQWCQITAGCDGQGATCIGKFNNFTRFGGFKFVPQRNLTLEAFNNQPVSRGGKK